MNQWLQNNPDPIPSENRHTVLFSVGLAMRQKGCDMRSIYAALININQRRCRPPLDYEPLRRIAESVVLDPSWEDSFLLDDDHPDTIAAFCIRQSPVRFRFHRQTWLLFENGRYRPVGHAQVCQSIRRLTARCNFFRQIRTGDEFKSVKQRLKVTTALAGAVLEALSVSPDVWIDPDLLPPAWIELPDPPSQDPPSGQENPRQNLYRPRADQVISFCDGLLDISADKPRRLDQMEEFFTLNYLPVRCSPAALCPRWRQFLNQLFRTGPDQREHGTQETTGQGRTQPDEGSICALQEFIGLLLTPVTRYQKALAVVGPRSSGRDILIRVIGALIGPENMISLSPADLADRRCTRMLLGRTAALIPDVCLAGSDGRTSRVVECLRAVIGEQARWFPGREDSALHSDLLSARFVITADQFTDLIDRPGRLRDWLVLLDTSQSDWVHDAHPLEQALIEELPGIANWAVEGYLRLRARGRFLPTGADRQAELVASPSASLILDFVRDCCLLKEGLRAVPQDLFDGFCRWYRRARLPEDQKPGRIRFYSRLERLFPHCARIRLRTAPDGNPVYRFPNIALRAPAPSICPSDPAPPQELQRANQAAEVSPADGTSK